jgi:hypothetical protein
MKKIILLILSAILLFALAVPAMAAGTAGITVSANTAHRGDTFTVTVSVKSEGVKKGTVELMDYSSSLELVKAEFLIDPFMSDFKENAGVFTYKDEVSLNNTKVIRFTFKVKDNAEFTTNSVTVRVLIQGNNDVERVNQEKTVNVTITCRHDYTAWTPSETDTESHTHKCNICGKEETRSHTYDNLCDVDCNDCGAVRVTEHVFAEE